MLLGGGPLPRVFVSSLDGVVSGDANLRGAVLLMTCGSGLSRRCGGDIETGEEAIAEEMIGVEGLLGNPTLSNVFPPVNPSMLFAFSSVGALPAR